MREALLHFLWLHIKYPPIGLTATDGQNILIISSGQHNQHAGPDFVGAQIIINQETWIGNIEVHLKSSDWYRHKHHTDQRYNNVILHVVWTNDKETYSFGGVSIPTIQMKDFVSLKELEGLTLTIKPKRKRFILCQDEIAFESPMLLNNWMDKLYLERLEEKCKEINELLVVTKFNWEEVLFIVLLRAFGLHQNKEIFFQLSNIIKYSLVIKIKDNKKQFRKCSFR